MGSGIEAQTEPSADSTDLASASNAATETPVPWKSWYSLGLLFVVYVFNFLDRSILGILNQPIKDELQLTDTQMGFLGGIAFAIFYTLVGIPIARLADKTADLGE